jgi:hypothetical protein
VTGINRQFRAFENSAPGIGAPRRRATPNDARPVVRFFDASARYRSAIGGTRTHIGRSSPNARDVCLQVKQPPAFSGLSGGSSADADLQISPFVRRLQVAFLTFAHRYLGARRAASYAHYQADAVDSC